MYRLAEASRFGSMNQQAVDLAHHTIAIRTMFILSCTVSVLLFSLCEGQVKYSGGTLIKSIPVHFHGTESEEPVTKYVRFDLFKDNISDVCSTFCEENFLEAESCSLLDAHLTKLAAKDRAAVTSPPEPTTTTTQTFAELGHKYGTDKVTFHGYDRFYPRFVEQYRSAPPGQAMLEIGVQRFFSLNMWLEYFPNAFVYGIDIGISMSGDRYEIFKADQGQESEVKRIVEHGLKHPLFLVVDDGSHYPHHQVLCFEILFGALVPGGTYIIEDIEMSYWVRGGNGSHGYRHEHSVVELFKHLLDDVNREFLNDENRRTLEERVGSYISAATRAMVSTVTFAHNCIIVTKKTQDEYQYSDRAYRFGPYL